jgi:putative flippase GtrA
MRSGFWFFGVAASAGLTHLAVFFLLERFLPVVLPELANFLAFCVAFSISFLGHRNLSFRDTTRPMQQSLLRFIVVSILGFISNEIVFIFCLRLLTWPSWLTILASFAVAGAQTYGLSRFWAFHRE